MVSPIPPTSPLASIHILLYQQITTGHIGTVVTVYDNAVLLCPEGVDRAQLLESQERQSLARSLESAVEHGMMAEKFSMSHTLTLIGHLL